MRLRGNENGIALAIVMVLSLVGIALAAALLYLAARWAGVTGMEKQYKTAYEAALGGTQVSFSIIGARADNTSLDNVQNYVRTIPDNCLNAKFNSPTAAWAAFGACDNSITIDIGTPTSYDYRFDLGNYRVYSKIVDTVTGNSAASLGLQAVNSVSNTGTGEVQVFSMPFLYTIEILSQRIDHPNERSRVSVLYQY